MKTCHKVDDNASRDTIRKTGYAFVISLALLLALESLTSSIVLKVKQDQLKKQLVIGRLDLQELLGAEGTLAYFSQPQNSTEVSDVLQRWKRDDATRSKKRRHQRNRRRRKGQRKPKKRKDKKLYNGYHLVIDSEYTQPESPHLTTRAEATISWWKEAHHLRHLNDNQNFAKLRNGGGVEILKDGLYYIYSQITYFDQTGSWSHRVDVGDNHLFTCVGQEWGVGTDPKTDQYFNTVHHCITTGVTRIHKGTIVTIKSLYGGRVIHANTDVTFWGIARLNT